jgi:hypothetical protein
MKKDYQDYLDEIRNEHSGETTEIPRFKNRLSMVKELIVTAYEKLRNKEMTVPDFVRLLSLEKEMAGEERVHEVRVQWVLPSDMESDS